MVENADKREDGAVDVLALNLRLDVLERVPEELAVRNQILPLRDDGQMLFVAAADPRSGAALDEVARVSERAVVAYGAPREPLAWAIRAVYSARRKGLASWRGPRAVADAAAALEPFTGDVSYRAEAPPLPPPGLRQRAHILIVDDEPVIRRLLQQALAQRGYEVMAASGGAEALKLVKEREPDTILLDAMLPDVHGFEICRRIKSSQRYRHIPVIMMTAVYKGWRIAADLRESYGVAATIEKPFDLHQVARYVEEALEGRPTEARPDAQALSADAQRLYGEARLAYRRGELEAAVQSLQQAVAIDPLAPALRHQLGLIHAQRGQDFAAIQELEMAVDLDSARFQTLRNLAVLYQRRGFRRKACELWERALSHAPDETTHLEIKGILVSLL